MAGQGELVAGRYRLLTRIGRGAMGVVWQASDERLDRTVAVKQLLADPDECPEDLAHREGRVSARLRHPNAIMVHDSLEHDGRHYLVMEYFPSSSLAALVTDGGPLPAERVAHIGCQVAAALAAAHGAGIVHRDVKPGNVLVDANDRAKIADFGIARALGDGTMTGGTLIVGTPAYLAPEVACGDHAGFSADVYSFGSTLYAALEGAPPFGLDENPIAMLRRVAQAAITPPRHRGPLTDVLLWMLRRNPGDRPTMREVEGALAAVVHGRPTGAPPPEPEVERPSAVRSPRTGNRPRRPAGVGLLALVLVAVGVLIGTLLPGRAVTIVTANPGSAGRPPASTKPTTPRPVPDTHIPTTTATSSTITHTSPPATSPTTAPATPTQQAVPQAASGRANCATRYAVTNSWPDGYQAQVDVVNNAGAAITAWTVRWALPVGYTIGNLWNGTLNQNGTAATVTNLSWNGSLAANGTATFGFTATAPAGTNSLTGDLPVLTCQTR
ncbi:MAG: protein kinase domain-containing protein [Labedaea sp.]